jgi:hypothetical protein
MSYAASLPSRKVDWHATKEKGGLSPSLEPRCGVIAAPLRLGHIPSPPPGSQFQNRRAKTGHRPSTWIDVDHRRPQTRCQYDSDFDTNCRSALERTNAARTLLYKQCRGKTAGAAVPRAHGQDRSRRFILDNQEAPSLALDPDRLPFREKAVADQPEFVGLAWRTTRSTGHGFSALTEKEFAFPVTFPPPSPSPDVVRERPASPKAGRTFLISFVFPC